MSETQDFEFGMSFWTACENLATVTEDVNGEETEEIFDEAESIGIKRFNSEGEECNEGTILDEECLTRISGRFGMKEEVLFLVGIEYEDEYLQCLSGNSRSKEQKCSYCKVLAFVS